MEKNGELDLAQLVKLFACNLAFGRVSRSVYFFSLNKLVVLSCLWNGVYQLSHAEEQ
jgi:hypothetical protein